MLSYYIITSLLVLINFIVLIFLVEGKKINYYFTIMFLLMVLSSLGYLTSALSTTTSEAVLANKIIYLGGCFVPPVLFFSICAVCNLKIKGWCKNLLYIFSLFVYFMVLSTGFSEIYYKKNFTLTSVYGCSVLGYEYGPGHFTFYIIIYGYIIMGVLTLIYSLHKKHTVSKKSVFTLLMLEIVNTSLFIISRVLDFPFEIMPAMYVLDGLILLYIHRRTSMYNIKDCVNSSLEKQDTYGYIVFDNKKNYLGCNSVAEKIVPDLKKCVVDSQVDDLPKMKIFLNWIKDYTKRFTNDFNYEYEDKHYECVIERIWYKEKPCGYIIELHEETEKWKYLDLISSYNFKLEERIRDKIQHIQNIQSQILLGIASVVENRDDSTGGHIKRTSDVIKILVDVIREKDILRLSDEFCEDLIKAAPMHDLGKIGIDDKILRKPGRLTEEEFAIMQSHVIKSAQLVEKILGGVEEEHFVNVAINVAKHHHEKWNGMGYPDKLKCEDIPLESRIMAIADVYDALVSKRCYKEPMSFEQAYNVMIESMGIHFDPKLEEVFILSREKLEEYYSSEDCSSNT
ncbi:MAG: HD domain-containing protein [Spirochaetaceae bacterium]|nr:HD domain-containing protein [Spirochaetaceae bacterium]